LKVELSKRAQRAVTRIDAHWRKRADHPELFFEEMLEVVAHLETGQQSRHALSDE
jgi:hypothetical protein